VTEIDPPPPSAAGVSSTDAAFIHSMLDQAKAMSRDMRADLPAAHAEARCVTSPIGCGQPLKPDLARHFRDQASRDEWRITGTCQSCQDLLFKPDDDEIAAMAANPDYERCDVCGEWRYLESVDVGVGVMRGHDCCADIRFRDEPRPPACTRTPGCYFCVDHAHECVPREKGETHA
jgi:hypothetical protein